MFLSAPCFCLGARARRAALGNGALSARALTVFLLVSCFWLGALRGARLWEMARLAHVIFENLVQPFWLNQIGWLP